MTTLELNRQQIEFINKFQRKVSVMAPDNELFPIDRTIELINYAYNTISKYGPKGADAVCSEIAKVLDFGFYAVCLALDKPAMKKIMAERDDDTLLSPLTAKSFDHASYNVKVTTTNLMDKALTLFEDPKKYDDDIAELVHQVVGLAKANDPYCDVHILPKPMLDFMTYGYKVFLPYGSGICQISSVTYILLLLYDVVKLSSGGPIVAVFDPNSPLQNEVEEVNLTEVEVLDPLIIRAITKFEPVPLFADDDCLD